MPIVVAQPDSPQAKAFKAIAAKLAEELGAKTAAPTGGIQSLLNKIKRPS